MDQTEITEIHEKYSFLIYKRCLVLLGSEDDAMDAFQDIFMKLIKYSGKTRDPELIVPWILRIVKNHCFNILRSRKKFVDNECLDSIHYNDSFDEKLSTNLLIKQILSFSNTKVQDAVYYTHIEQLDQKEIQKITGQSPATIRRNLGRFNKSISLILKNLGIEL